jgi:hypothetical protein
VVNSVVSKASSKKVNGSINSNSSCLNVNNSNNNNNNNSGMNSVSNSDAIDDFDAGICTIVDTENFSSKAHLYDENQQWIVAHFLAHYQESIYALEFNHSGRLLVSADCQGQYFNVFQINVNPFKCTRTVVKHLYSLYRGDTSAKVRNMSFSSDSRWLAVSTKRGTTHIFPLNCYGGPVNARTHSKRFVVNKTTKHQRTAGYTENDDQHQLTNSNNTTNSQIQQTAAMNSDILQHQQQQQHHHSSPFMLTNNPKLKSLMEPLVIAAYGQLKQPNANSTLQSSVISSSSINHSSSLLQTTKHLSPPQNNNKDSLTSRTRTGSLSPNQVISTNVNNNQVKNSSGSNIAASAISSAALVTENVTNFGIKNFSLLASNTSNMIQYDNVCPIALFADSRGYLSPEEPRDYSLNRLKPASSLFVISDVNGNLVEYTLDVIIDTTKMPNNKPTNDSPVQLKLTPKAQWPLERFISSREVRYPIDNDNPLLLNGLIMNNNNNNGSSSRKNTLNDITLTNNNDNNGFISTNSPTSVCLSSSSSSSSSTSTSSSHSNDNSNNNDWIKQIEATTHIGPHRRLFMGPQFIFKTFNSNLQTTLLNPTSSSVMSDVKTSIIDLSGDIELNTLE